MSKYTLIYSLQFKKDYKKYRKSEKDSKAIQETIRILANEGHFGLSQAMLPHRLRGNYKGYWECHIKPDLLLIWEQSEEPDNEIALVRVGSHSELF